jgi:hypothetical protein
VSGLAALPPSTAAPVPNSEKFAGSVEAALLARRLVADHFETARHASDIWLISDIYLDGAISEMATRRSEFAEMLKSQGIDGLIAALNRKAGHPDRDYGKGVVAALPGFGRAPRGRRLQVLNLLMLACCMGLVAATAALWAQALAAPDRISVDTSRGRRNLVGRAVEGSGCRSGPSS